MGAPALTTVQLGDSGDDSLQATFVPGAGMMCCSLRHRDEELLAQNAGLEAYVQHGKTMGIPLLYPWANRLAGFDYTVAGRTVTVPRDPTRIALDGAGLPIHGVIGGRQHWTVTSTLGHKPSPDPQADGPHAEDPGSSADDSGAQTADPDDPEDDPSAPSHLAATLTWSESEPELFAVFPFRHDIHYEARLDTGRLEVTITVDACGDDHVPVAFGLHPYLSPPGAARERYGVELPAMRQLALDDRQIPIGPDRALPAQWFELGEREYDDGFDSVAGPATFAVRAGTRRIELELVEGYPCAQVYAPHSGQFICFEPMTAPANALRSGTGLRVLEPGERHRATFAIRVQDVAPAGDAQTDSGR